MKVSLLPFAVGCVLITVVAGCPGSNLTAGGGGSSPDTLFIKAENDDQTFVLERNVKEEGGGGSSRDTLYIKANENARFYKVKKKEK